MPSTTEVLMRLAEAVSPEELITDPASMASYQRDCSPVVAADPPLAVIRPRSIGTIQALMRWAHAHAVAVVPRGAGTGLSGGAAAPANSIVLSLEHLAQVHIDPDARVAIAGPGALNATIKTRAAEHGLWYPPDPGSFEISTIGGNVATNAGGLCCVKYGVTTDYVLGLRVVLADGRVVTLGGPLIKDVAGLSLTKLFVGSEGTLGIIVEVTLRLIPTPAPASTLVATFRSMEAAAQAVLEIIKTTRPSTCELMDGMTINALEDHLRMGLDRSTQAMLLVRSDLPGVGAAEEIRAVASVCRGNHAVEVFETSDPQEGDDLASARRMVGHVLERLGTCMTEDIGVAVAKLPQLVKGIEEIAAKNALAISVVAHAGDGNTHPTIIFDPREPGARERATAAFGQIMDLGLALGGTITGEHGIGRMKVAWLGRYLGEDVLGLNRTIKDALDPRGILNPGALFPAEETS